VVRVRTVDQPHVQRQRGAGDELLEKGSDDVLRHAADPNAGEVDVRHEQRLLARLQRDVRQRLGGRDDRGPVPANALAAQGIRERLAERASGRAHFFLGVAWSHFERHVERRVGRKQAEQVVEGGDPCRDVGGAAPVDGHTHLRVRVVDSIRRGHGPASVPHRFCCFKRWAKRPISSTAQSNSVLRGLRGRAFVSLGCVVTVLCAAAASPRHERTAARRLDVSVGYASPAALTAALATEHAGIVRRVPALRIARVRLDEGGAATLTRLPGIRFVERVTQRANAAEPALQAATGKNTPWEWQFTAAREDRVPDWVQRAASSVTIAVVDTGADVSAPDIAAKNPTTFSPRTGTTDVRDTVGHGTFVAALAAGSVTNGEGIAGFGGDAKLMVVKAGAGDGSISDVDETAAISYAVDHGARIINLSFGGTTTSTAEKNAIDYATSHGVLVVAAAGNHYLTGNQTIYPAALVQPLDSKGVGGTGLAVGASTATGTRAAFSSTGSYISVAAPGDGVFSAVASTSSASSYPRVPLPGSLHGLYGYGSGTSFAAPEVSGAAALVMAANPLLNAQDVSRIIKTSASGRGAWTPELGFGVLDVGSAVELARGVRPEAAQAGLKLVAHVVRGHVTLTAQLTSFVPAVATARRSLVFDRYNATGRAWRPVGTVRTGARGQAMLTLAQARKPLRLRARWTGAADLAAAASKPVRVKALR
jgi:subtilisin family serine protease